MDLGVPTLLADVAVGGRVVREAESIIACVVIDLDRLGSVVGDQIGEVPSMV